MFDQSIRRMVLETGMDFQTFALAIGDSLRFVLKWWNYPELLRLTDRHYDNIKSYFGLTEGQLFAKTMPLDLIRQKFVSGPMALNEIYFKDAFSHVRTTAHIVKYLSIRFGRHKVDQMLRKLGVHPSIYANQDNVINIDYFVDLLHEAEIMGLSKTEIHHLSSFMFLSMKNTELGREFAEAGNYAECYEVLDQNFKNFDKNFIYSLNIRDNGFSLKIEPGEVLARKIRDQKLDRSQLAMYRKNMACWFPYLSGLPPLFGILSKSLAFGDRLCIIEAEFPNTPLKRATPPQIQSVEA